MEFEIGDGLVNIEGTDIASVVRHGKRIVFYIEDGHDAQRILRKIKGAKGLLICIHCTKNTTTRDCQRIVESLSESVKKSAKVIWGAKVGRKKKLLVIAVW